MAYKTLKTVAYEAHHDIKTIQAEYDRRQQNYGVFKTGLFPYLKKGRTLAEDSREMFLIPLREIAISSERIEYNSAEIKSLMAQLPAQARQLYIDNKLALELLKTNQLAGLKPSRPEVAIAMEQADTKSFQQIRFAPMARMYRRLVRKDYQRIESLVDIRKIYDQLLAGLIDPQQLPDGAFFRAGKSTVLDKNRDGVYDLPADENGLENRLQHWLQFISNKNIPFMIKGLLAHAYFINIRPFYDGNLRTARYILTSYLARKLDIITALSLASAISDNQEKFQKALSAVDDYRNYAEGSFFVLDMLSMIEEKQQQLLEELSASCQAFQLKNEKIRQQHATAETDYYVLNTLLQSGLFAAGIDQGLLDRDILSQAKKYGLSKRAVGLALKDLTNRQLIQLVKKNPMQHVFEMN